MNLTLSTLIFVAVLILMWQAKRTKGSLFMFLAADEHILQDCENEPDYLGVADMMDISNLKVELLDDSVHIEGSVEIVWNVDPDDRVELTTNVFKYDRGTWQPTVFTLISKDFCRTLFDENDMWYQSWSRFIDGDEKKCINNKGVVYHHIPFDLKTIVNITGEDISGLHKLVVKVDAFNLDEDKKPNSVCFQVPGDIIKL